MIASAGPFPMSIMIVLVIASILSWTVIFSKWKIFKQALDEAYDAQLEDRVKTKSDALKLALKVAQR